MGLENFFFYIAIGIYAISMILYLIFFIARKEKPGVIATYILYGGFLSHTVALVTRGIEAGRVPLTNQYEFATSFAWGIVLLFIIFEKKFSFKAMGTFVMPIILLVIGYAAMQSRDIRPLMPALQSNWLVFHVATAVISYGAFGVACGVSVMYLVIDRMGEDSFISKHVP